MQKLISLRTMLSIANISASTGRRLVKEDGLPEPKKVGNQLYFETKLIYDWLSKQADREVKEGDRLFSSKQLEVLFDKSSAFIWYTFQKNKTRKAKAIYLRSRPYWLESEILADPELCEYLEVAQKEVA